MMTILYLAIVFLVMMLVQYVAFHFFAACKDIEEIREWVRKQKEKENKK